MKSHYIFDYYRSLQLLNKLKELDAGNSQVLTAEIYKNAFYLQLNLKNKINFDHSINICSLGSMTQLIIQAEIALNKIEK